MLNRDLINITDLTRTEIEQLLLRATAFKQKPYQPILTGKIIASCFFEASTRTRLSFETAAQRLGASVVGFADAANTSQRKGETLQDTLKIIASYVDALVIRHPEAGSAQIAADSSDKPVINAGDGGNQHPTQTLLDLFTMQETQGRLEGLKVGLVGDLKYGRTIHSLVQAGALFNMEFYCTSPATLPLPEKLIIWLKERGIRVHQEAHLNKVIPKVDILYMTRLQKERFTEQDSVSGDAFILTVDALKQAKPNLKVLHPLPRVDEIPIEVDHLPCAYYFQQAANGVPVRQALLEAILC